MTSADILTISLYSDVRTYFHRPPYSVGLHRVCTVRRGCRNNGREETGGCGKKCMYCPLLPHFFLLTTGLHLPECFNQPSRIVNPMGNAKIKSEAHIRAIRRGMVSSLTHRGICGREVGWRWIALWLMLDGKREVGYTPIFLFLFIIISVSCPLSPKALFILWNWCTRANCAPRLLSICVFLVSFAGLASDPPITRFSELIFFLYVPVASYRWHLTCHVSLLLQ